MLLRMLVLLLCILPGYTKEASYPTIQEFAQRIIAHERYYDPFVREVFGCKTDPSIPIAKENCQDTPHINVSNYIQARKRAMVLYDLHE